MRTKEDWQNFHQEKKAIEDDCVVETTIDRLLLMINLSKKNRQQVSSHHAH